MTRVVEGGRSGTGAVSRSVAGHDCWTVIVTGSKTSLPGSPAEDAVLIEAAPGRSIAAVLSAAMLSLRPVWLVNVTPVVVQPGWPLSAVIVAVADHADQGDGEAVGVSHL